MRYPLWMRLEHFLRHFPPAARLLRRLVRQETTVPRRPAGARAIAMAAVRARLTLSDLLHGALRREDRYELYLAPDTSLHCYYSRYSSTFDDVYFVQTRRCADMAEVDAFFGPSWRTGRFFVYPENAKQVINHQPIGGHSGSGSSSSSAEKPEADVT